MGSNGVRPVSDSWSAQEWAVAYERAAAFLATGERWVVGPAVVAMYRRGMERSLVREQAERAG